MKKNLLRLMVAFGLMTAFTLMWSGCNTVPVTGRSQLSLISASEEMQLGLTSFDQLKKETPISTDAALAKSSSVTTTIFWKRGSVHVIAIAPGR